ncbi:hypothetical protein P8452_73295 [Trifolium repens]|nr:hypothetical protein P8452_73295 [Trifolium repens]
MSVNDKRNEIKPLTPTITFLQIRYFYTRERERETCWTMNGVTHPTSCLQEMKTTPPPPQLPIKPNAKSSTTMLLKPCCLTIT